MAINRFKVWEGGWDETFDILANSGLRGLPGKSSREGKGMPCKHIIFDRLLIYHFCDKPPGPIDKQHQRGVGTAHTPGTARQTAASDCRPRDTPAPLQGTT